MNKLILTWLIAALVLGGTTAQDWRADEDSETRYNCDLVAALTEAYGGEPLLQMPDDGIASLADFLDLLFPACQSADTETEQAAPTEADADADTSDVPAAEVIVLESDENYTIHAQDCVVVVDARYDADFNVSITGEREGGIAVDVYPPGADEPLVMDRSDEYSVSLGVDVPVRVEWASGDDFPLGRYSFRVRIAGDVYRFEWVRTDPAYRTFAITCPPGAEGEGAANALADGEKQVIDGTMCLVWTEAWDEDFNLLIIGEPQASIAAAVTFPDEAEPAAMDDAYASEFDDGTPYRVEWVAGRYFPLGEYKIDVTIEGEKYAYTWGREDSEINTVGVECIDPDEAIPADEFLAELEAGVGE